MTYCPAGVVNAKPLSQMGNAWDVGPAVGPPLTFSPSSFCQGFEATNARSPAYSVQYVSTWTPCSGTSSYYHSPCSLYSTQSQCGDVNPTGYHTLDNAYTTQK